MKSLFKCCFQKIPFALVLGLFGAVWAASGCAQIGPSKGVSQTTPLEIKPRMPEAEEIQLRAGQLPEVTLTSSIVFRILAAEISAQRSAFIPAGKTMLDLAKEVGDVRLARRALEFYLAGGNLAGALESSRVWLRFEPDDAEALSTEMTLSAASGQTSGLTTALRKKIDEARDKTAAIGQAMAILGRVPDKRAGLAILISVLQESQARDTLPAHIAISDLARAAGDAPRALSAAKAALNVAPRSEDAAMRVFEYGLAVDAPQAFRDAQGFAAAHPKARRLRLLLATQWAERREFDLAMAELVAMAKLDPEDIDLVFMQGQIAYRAKRLPEARNLLEQYVSRQSQRQSGAPDEGSGLVDAYQLLSRIAQDQGFFDDAVSLLDNIQEPSARHNARVRQAAIRAQQGRVDDALALLDTSDPQSLEEEVLTASAGAQMLREAKRPLEAIKRLEAANERMPDTVEIKYELAMMYERDERLNDTERLLREVIALDPGHAHSYNALGYSLADRNQRLPEALKLITRALEIAPNDPFIMDSMGWIKFRLGDYVTAVQYLEKAYRVRPEADIAAHLGEALWMLGQRDAAIEIWKKAVAKEADNATLQETIKRLGVRL
ncbi:MAG: tetratricopeptide repeat protein [Candidatus Methylopumilus sp.]|nr:tetratricopeptide repeat protein [Candidatus Methylopumilus sp.]